MYIFCLTTLSQRVFSVLRRRSSPVSAKIAATSGLPRQELYDMALALKNKTARGDDKP